MIIAMKPLYSKELSLEELAALPDENIDYSDIAELDASFWNDAKIVLPEDKNRLSQKR